MPFSPGFSTAQQQALDQYRSQAEALWSLQESLRAKISGLEPVPLDDAHLVPIAELLAEGYTVENCQHVLEVFASEPAEKARVYFNGAVNWRQKNFRMALGQGVRKSSGEHYTPTGREKRGRGAVLGSM